jgi:tetratricopeptide (TPR) repeat protein
MSYLLESLGRGLLPRLLDAFDRQLPGRDDDDVRTLQHRSKDSPASADLLLRLGKAYLREMRLAEAGQTFEAALNLEGGPHFAAIGLACVSDELGRLDQAAALLTAAAVHDSRDPALQFGIGFCKERAGDATAAASSYRSALELCPTLRNAHERLAAIAMHRGDWTEAVACYQRLADLEPDDLDTQLMLATLHLNHGQPADAVDTFQRALLIEPEVSGEALDCADELEDDGQLAEAIASVEKLVAKYPGVTEFHVHLGDLYVKAAEDDRAIEHYNLAIGLHPSFLEATVKLGTQHLRRGRYGDAALAFNRAVELNDRLLIAFVGLGFAQASCGNWNDAHATYGLAAGLAPNSTLLLAETARLQLKTERRRHDPGVFDTLAAPDPFDPDECLTESVRRHQQALVLSSDDADLQYRYGMLVRQLGGFDEAISALERAVAINPGFCKALVKLGICLRESGQADKAAEVFRRAMTATPDAVNLHYSLALMFAQRNQFELAMERYEDSAGGRNSALRSSIALSLQNVGMVDRAAATWRSICDLSWRRAALPTDRFAEQNGAIATD